MWWKRKPEDFKAEIDAHLQLEADELRSEGLPPAEAQSAARRALGNRTSIEERFYDSRSWISGQHLARDLRFAARVLSKDAKFSVLAVLGLALGIGVSTAIFALVDTISRAGIENVRDPASYISLERRQSLDSGRSFAEFRYFQDHATALGDFSAESGSYHLILGATAAGGDSEDVMARFESENAFSVRRLQPTLGRSFSRKDEQPGSPPVALLSHRFWDRRFGGDAGILGKTIVLNARTVTIIGVAGSRFHQDDAAVLYLPLRLQPVLLDQGDWLLDSQGNWLTVTARLLPGLTLAHAQAEADVLGKAFFQSNSTRLAPATGATASRADAGVLLSEGGANPRRRRDASARALAIDLAVSMILLIACSNLASLLLARAAVRHREMGVRLSLGASRGRLICQLLTESLLLAIAGGALGIVFSSWLAKWLFLSLNQRAATDFHLDYRVLLYGLALSVVTGFSFGFGPALAATKTNLARALHAEGLSGTPNSPSLKIWAPRNLLVVIPLGASLMLLIGAALMVRSVKLVQLSGPAFDTSRVIAMSFRLKHQGYGEARTVQFQESLRERLRAMPGVTSVALATSLPLSLPSRANACGPTREGPALSTPRIIVCNVVSAGYFETLGVPPVRGRTFTAADRQGSAPVVMVNQELAQRFWPNEEPIGKRIVSEGGGTLFEVVGVASNLDDTTNPIFVDPMVYVPLGQDNLLANPKGVSNEGRTPVVRYPIDQMQFLIRTNGNTNASVKAALRQAVRAADSSLWVNIQTIEEGLEPFTGPIRIAMFILTALGALVLVMASMGIYALLAYSVSQRTHEIGVRMALGAHRRQILSLVMQRTLILIGCGIVLGLSGALALNRILASVVHNTERTDVVTCVEVALLLGGISLLASYLPARKALRVDPVQALRWE